MAEKVLPTVIWLTSVRLIRKVFYGAGLVGVRKLGTGIEGQPFRPSDGEADAGDRRKISE
jgi:hypothetical protein